ncbi:MAG TPA: serine protease, partial [Longimicrobiaceae bacterium]|nr:serine protease [Longimicrobiaceae bacterium]
PPRAVMNALPTARFGRLPLLLAACAAAIPTAACAGHRGFLAVPGEHAFYQTAFPTWDTSATLRRTFESVRRIQISATYDTYTFARERAPTEGELGSPDLLRGAMDTTSLSQERAATAVVLSRSAGNVALLTANHALELPDTIVRFFGQEGGLVGAPTAPGGSRLVESVSIKRHQTNWVVGESLETFEILARDSVRDLALIGVREPVELPRPGPIAGARLEEQPRRTPVLALPAGDSDRLSWGSFVYVLGYPKGYPMVTRGIVSAPERRPLGSFLVDGLWNRGMSGGLILAVRGDGRGLEWVGIARGASSTSEARLVPDEGAEPRGNVRQPYDGQIFLEEYRSIDYGITLSVPIADIRRFLAERRTALGQQGYVLPRI